MSEGFERAISADAMTIEDMAADWSAMRRMSKNWSAERQAELEEWLARSPAHRVAYLRIEATWRRTERLAALREPMRKTPSAASLKKIAWRHLAAAFGLVLLAGIAAENYFSHPRGQLIETPRGGQERLLLADGSQVELNTDTAIRVNLSGQARAVELVRGEAFFQVKHDASRPFVVTAGSHKVTDLGTKFLMRMAPQSLHVMLMEGKAQLENDSSREKAVVLSPGDVAVATAETTRVTRKPIHDLSESLAWQHGAIIFRNERLADAVAEFNRYGGRQLAVTGEGAADLKINGTFQTGGAEDFAGIAHEIFGLHVKRENGNIVLSR